MTHQEAFEQRMEKADVAKLEHQYEYECTLDYLAEIRLQKCIQYGEARYDPTMNHVKQKWLCYSDVYRKFIRLEQQMASGTTQDLLETYSDLANYAIMAVQLLRRELK